MTDRINATTVWLEGHFAKRRLQDAIAVGMVTPDLVAAVDRCREALEDELLHVAEEPFDPRPMCGNTLNLIRLTAAIEGLKSF